jgi:hypothetical protein
MAVEIDRLRRTNPRLVPQLATYASAGMLTHLINERDNLYPDHTDQARQNGADTVLNQTATASRFKTCRRGKAIIDG